jgi:hypothetical protein
MINLIKKPADLKDPLEEKMTLLADSQDEKLNSNNTVKEKMGFL